MYRVFFPCLKLADADPFNTVFLISLVFLYPEMQTLRVTLASVGISFVAASATSFSVQLVELVPTIVRYMSLWMLSQGPKWDFLIHAYTRYKHSKII